MKTLVTGANGFAGRHLTRELVRHGHAVIAMDLHFPSPVKDASEHITADLRDRDAVARAVADARPEACVHLGAVSFVPAGNRDPALMLSVNVAGTFHLLDALREHAPACRTCVVSSSQIYGTAVTDSPLPETAPIAPLSLYAASKAAADLAALAAANLSGLPVMTARPSNHTGPGQSSDFVIPSFIRQIRAIAAKQAPPVIQVGNLESERVLFDVRDVVRAYRLILEKGTPGLAYNISSPGRFRIADILDILCRMAGVQADRKADPSRFRPTDKSPILDTTRIRLQTGWQPEIQLEVTLRDMIAAE